MDDSAEPTHLRGIGAFGMIPEWLLVAPISSTAKVLFGWMACKYANRATWACWPGQARLADDLGVSVNTIYSAIKELTDVGALTKQHRTGADGAPSTNYYQLVFLPTTRKLGYPQKTGDTHPQKTGSTYPKKTVNKPDLIELEVPEREVRRAPVATLVESPIAWHKRHGSHVQEFCDWVCFPQELASQFANRASLTDTDILTWAQSVRQTWQQAKKVPTGSMYDFWNARWAERQNITTTDADSFAERHRRRREREAEEEQKKQEAYRKWQARVRAEMAEMARVREEIEREQQQSGE